MSPKRATDASRLYFRQQNLRVVLLILFAVRIRLTVEEFCMGLPEKSLYGHFCSLQRVLPQTRFLNRFKINIVVYRKAFNLEYSSYEVKRVHRVYVSADKSVVPNRYCEVAERKCRRQLYEFDETAYYIISIQGDFFLILLLFFLR